MSGAALSPEDPWAGYARTVVEIAGPQGPVTVRAAPIGVVGTWLWGAPDAVFVMTAWDPGEERRGVAENRRWQAALEEDVRRLTDVLWGAAGVDPETGHRDEGWRSRDWPKGTLWRSARGTGRTRCSGGRRTRGRSSPATAGAGWPWGGAPRPARARPHHPTPVRVGNGRRAVATLRLSGSPRPGRAAGRPATVLLVVLVRGVLGPAPVCAMGVESSLRATGSRKYPQGC
jgi:hypothetical protein